LPSIALGKRFIKKGRPMFWGVTETEKHLSP
jgi:hypothetical protein